MGRGVGETDLRRALGLSTRPRPQVDGDGPGGVPTVTTWPDENSVNAYSRRDLPLRWLRDQGAIWLVEDKKGVRLPTRGVLVMQLNSSIWRLQQIEPLQRSGVLVVEDEDEWVHGLFEHDWEGLPTICGAAADTYIAKIFRSRDRFRRALRQGVDMTPSFGPFESEVNRRDFGVMLSGLLSLDTLPEAMAFYHRTMTSQGVNRGTVSLVDLVTVSTEELAAQIEPLGPRAVTVLPSCIDLHLPCYVASAFRSRPSDPVTLGFAGTYGHKRDLAGISTVLDTIMREYDGQDGCRRVRLMIGGEALLLGPLRDLPGMAAFRAMVTQWDKSRGPDEGDDRFHTLESDCGRYIYRSFTTDIPNVPAMYQEVDIGLVPNWLDDPFNISKTDIKGLEMAGMGVSCVASPIPAYRRHRPAGTGAIVLKSNAPTLWLEALRRLIDDDELRARMSMEARAFAQTRSIQARGHLWLEAYEEAARRTGKRWPT